LKKKLQTNIAVNGQIIHRNVGRKCFFHLTIFLLLSLVFAYIHISQGSVETFLPCGRIYNNQSIIGEDMDKSKVARFLWPTLYKVFRGLEMQCWLWQAMNSDEDLCQKGTSEEEYFVGGICFGLRQQDVHSKRTRINSVRPNSPSAPESVGGN